MREFEVLHEIYERNDRLGSRVIVPPGDDLAAVRLERGAIVLTGVDQVVEGRHFDPSKHTWRQVGRKAVARSLSDLAAMAARPTVSLATGVLPRDFPKADALELFEGMHECADAYDCPLVGGDLAVGIGPVVCTVTVLGEPGPTGKIIMRSGAKPGDSIYLTGRLGGAWKSDHHLNFEPRIKLALALVESVDIHAMIDISDGLGRDLDHIAEMSKLAAEIDASFIPLSDCSDVAGALGDGEDYELCFTAPANANIPSQLLDISITRIGQMLELGHARSQRTTVIMEDGERRDAARMGWEHGNS